MRTMYDAVTARNILAASRTPQMVAGYIDKIRLEPWTAADWALFPGSVKVTIVKKASTNDGHVLDVEQGDAAPGEAPGWVAMRRRAGADPTVYCNTSTWPLVKAAFGNAGIPEPHYWIAGYDNDPAIPVGAVAKQYRETPGYDVSSVADFWPGVDSVPAPAPTPANPSGVELMERKTIAASPDTTSVRLLLSGSPGAAIIVRPHIGPDGFAKNPVWVGNIFAWGNDHSGVGGNPKLTGANPKVMSHRRYELSGAVWCDLEYSSIDPFDLDIVG